jgi:peptidylprolyl isomerase
MAAAKAGDTVRVHYTGTLGDGEVFDSSEGREPLEFQLGQGQVIAGFDEAVTGMAVGDEKTVTIPSDEAYGERRDEMVMRIPRAQLPADLDAEVGQALQMSNGRETVVVTVRELNDDHVVFDANHPLAGKDLTFALTLVEIV